MAISSDIAIIEPDYLAQTSDVKTIEELRSWQDACIKSAKAAGCVWPRWSYDGDGTYLFEAWKEGVSYDEAGPPRFQYVRPA